MSFESEKCFAAGPVRPSEVSLLENANTLQAEPVDLEGDEENLTELEYLERENGQLKAQLEERELQLPEPEGQDFRNIVQNYESHCEKQEEEIKRLILYIDTLSAELNNQENQLKERPWSEETSENRIRELESENFALIHQLTEEKRNTEKLKEAFQKIGKNYSNLQQKNAQRTQFGDLEHQLAIKDSRIEELERDKEVLAHELTNCETYITNQVQEMKKVSYYLDCLAQESHKRQSQRKLKTAFMKTETTEEITSRCHRIKQLKNQVSKYKKKLEKNTENHKILREKLESEKRSKEKTEEAFVRIAEIYEELLKKNDSYEALQAECDMVKRENGQLREKTDQLENEKNRLLEEIGQYSCRVQNQNAKIEKLSSTVEQMSEMEAHLGDYEQDMATAQTELQHLSHERTCMCNQMANLLSQIDDYASQIAVKDDKNQVLLQTLEKEKLDKAKLEMSVELMGKSHQHLTEMLHQAAHTIKCITQKLEEYDIERLETQRDHQVKISELEGQLLVATATIKKLRDHLDEMKGVMDRNVTLRTISAQLHKAANVQVTQLQRANEDLSRRSQKMAEMYNYMKKVLYEKDKTFEELRNRLLALRQQLDDEQKLREDTEETLAEMAASGDSALAELHHVINSQNDQINQLQEELEELMRTTPVGALKTRIQHLETENTHLRRQLKKVVADLKAVLPGYIDPEELSKLKEELAQLAQEVERQKKEIETQKKMRYETVVQKEELCRKIQELVKENAELKRSKPTSGEDQQRKMQELRKENEELKLRKSSQSSAVVVVERNKVEGQPEYRYLYGVQGKKSESEEMAALRKQLAEAIQKRDGLERNLGEVMAELQSVRKESKKTVEKSPEDPLEVALRKQLEEENDDLKRRLDIAIAELQSQGRSKAKAEEPLPRQLLQAPLEKETLKTNLDRPLQKQLSAALLERDELRTNLDRVLAELQSMLSAQKKPPDSKNQSTSVSGMSARSERDELLEEIEMQKREISELLKKIRSHSTTNTRELQEKDDEIAQLKSLITNLQDQLRSAPKLEIALPTGHSELNNVVMALQNNLEQEQNQVIELEELWRHCETKCEMLTMKNRDLEEDKTDLEEQIGNLRKLTVMPPASEVYTGQLQELTKDLHEWQDGITNAIDNLKTSVPVQKDENVVHSLTEQIDELKKTLFENLLTDKKESIASEAQNLHIVELQKQLRESQENNEELRQTIEDLQKALGKRSSGSEDDKFCEDKLQETQLALNDLKRQNENLTSEVTRLRSQKKSVFYGAPGAQTSKRKKEAPVQQNESDKDKRLRELEELLEKWQKDHDEDIGKLRQEMDKFSRRSYGTIEGCPAHKQIIDDQETALQTCHRQKEALEKENARLDTEVARLTKSLDQYTDHMDAPMPGGESSEKKTRDLVEHVRDLERRNEGMTTKIIQLDLENERLKSDLQKLVGPDSGNVEKALERLRDVEKQVVRSNEKYQHLKKRLMKVEIENRNLKKEYIDTLIAKEKIALHNQEQDKRLREMNKLLRKAQDKKSAVTSRIIKLQIENQNLQAQLDSALDKEPAMKVEDDVNESFQQRMAEMEAENEYLRNLLDDRNQSDQPFVAPEKHPPRPRVNLKKKIIELEIENEFIRSELYGLKRGDSSVDFDLVAKVSTELIIPPEEDLEMKAYELEKENELLKKELDSREKQNIESGITQKQITSLEEQVHKLVETNETLNLKNIELELENEYMKRELDKINQEEESTEDVIEKDWEKQTHALKLKADNLEIENRNLKAQIAEIGKTQITMETHTQEKILREIQRLVHDYELMKDSALPNLKLSSKESLPSAAKGGDRVEVVADRLQQWRDQYEPRLQELKENFERLTGSSKDAVEAQLQECKGKVEELEVDSVNMKIALEVLLKDKPAFSNVRLIEEVETLLAKYHSEEEARKANQVDLRKYKELEMKHKECQETNELLRNQLISLERHNQDKRIGDLEAQIREYQFYDSTELEQQLRGKKSIVIDVQLMRMKELHHSIEEHKENNRSLKKQLEQLETEKASCESRLQKLQAVNEDLEKARKTSDFHQNLTADLNKQLQECRKEKDELLMKRARTSRERVGFVGLKDEDKDLEQEYTKLESQYSKLKQLYEEQRQQIASLEEQLRKCREVNTDLKGKMASLGSDQTESEDRNESKDQQDTKESEKKDKEDDQAGSQDKEESKDQHDRIESQDKEEPKYQQDRIESEEKGKDKLQEVDRQPSVQSLTKQLDDLFNRNLSLEVYAKRAKKLEVLLIQSRSSYRKVLIELEGLRRDKMLVQYKQIEGMVTELEKRLRESKEQNGTLSSQLQRLNRELDSKDEVEQENRKLKQQVYTLKRSLNSTELDNKNLKHDINSLVREIDELKIIQELQKPSRSNTKELEYKNEEIKKLNLLVVDLKKQIEVLAKVRSESSVVVDFNRQIMDLAKMQPEEGRGDDDKRVRKLEQTLLKYQDNNKNLRLKISQLDNERTNLRVQLDGSMKIEKKLQESDAQARKIRKLEETLQKYRDNIEILKKKVGGELGDRQEKGQDLKIATDQIACVKERLHGLMERATNTGEAETLKPEKTNFVGSLKKQFEKDIEDLSQRAPFLPQKMFAQQPIPVLWQPHVLPYGQYLMSPPQPEVKPNPEDLENLSSLVDKIQKTLDKSKRQLDAIKKSEKVAGKPSEDIEKVQDLFDFETYSRSQIISTESSDSAVTYSRFGSLKVDELEKKQRQVKEKITGKPMPQKQKTIKFDTSAASTKQVVQQPKSGQRPSGSAHSGTKPSIEVRKSSSGKFRRGSFTSRQSGPKN